MQKRYQLFVSSTFEDLHEERQAVIQALLEIDCIPAGMELFPAADEDQMLLIKRIIDDCDYFILIIGGRYGSTDQSGKSYIEKEYDYAASSGKPIISFIHLDPTSLPSNKVETTPEGQQKLFTFKEKVKKKLCKYWESSQELAGLVSRSVMHLIFSKPSEGWVRGRFADNPCDLKELDKFKRELVRRKEDFVMPSLEREFSDFENVATSLVDYFEVRKSISIAHEDTGWVFRLIPSLAWVRLSGKIVRVCCGEPCDERSLHRLGLLVRLGCQVRVLKNFARSRIELFLFDSDYENFGRAIVLNSPESQRDYGYATAYSRGIDKRILPLLKREFDELWQQGKEISLDSGPEVTLQRIGVDEVIRRLKTGVAQYSSPDVEITFDYIELSKIKFLDSRLYLYKYFQIRNLLRLYDSVEVNYFEPIALCFADDKVSILTPPVVEIWNSDAVVINGSHRCFYTYHKDLVEKVGCIVVKNVTETLPGEFVAPSKVSLESQRQPPGTRIIGFNYSRYRHIESAVHPSEEMWLPTK